MKKIIYKIALTFIALILVHGASASVDSVKVDSTVVTTTNSSSGLDLWERANNAYTSSNYEESIKLYNEILDSGLESFKLYYNLGNAYFKNGDNAKAIANYKRAERLAPMNKDIKHNIAIADGMTKNRIESLPEFFLYTFYKDVRGVMSSNSWAVVSLVAFALVLLLVMFYLLSNTPVKRKIGFTGAIVMLVLFVMSVSFSVKLRDQIKYSSEAVVLSSAEAVKSSPNSDGKDVFIINEGSVVDIIDSLGEWSEIVVASGNRGWIKTKALEVI